MEITSVPMILEAISQALPDRVSIAVADDSKFIYYQPSPNIDLKIKPGDIIKEGSSTYKALRVKEQVTQFVTEDVYGVPYYGVAIPLINRGITEGCITAIFPQMMSQEAMKLPKHHFLIGKSEDRWIPVPYEEILFIQSNAGKTMLFTGKENYVNKYGMGELEQILPRDQFIRCHRSYFVNVHGIREIHPHFHSTFMLVMNDKNKTRIPVSQSYASYFRQMLGF
ncbi:LytTR family DNA-binding domain-containing protein [Brevibacillus dissolubilis]|uniref:LytTR family DNA-binding domain-containing protein n=1 Tax=Brevibacillus dissolubilis TaxID=1844116 RepID=UPI0011178150|nr:LytTR family DNA-binding domain-containing protein [Brevibacillus dissolubilis]